MDTAWGYAPIAPTLTTAPTADVLTLEEVKAHLRVDDDDSDGVIELLRDAATSRLDGWSGILGRALMPQTWTAYFDGFDSRLRLPLLPVASVSSVKSYDAANVLQTFGSSNYQLLTDHRSPYVALTGTNVWPTSLYGRADAVAVAFVAGYANAAAVPAAIKAAMLLMIGDLFEARESFVIGANVAEIPTSTTVQALLAPYRAGSF